MRQTMTTAKQENEVKSEIEKAAKEMLFFQNMLPGLQQSPFIDRFKDRCLDPGQNEEDEVDQFRRKLLNESPPVLSFTGKKQKDKFYEEEAKNCQQFCCGGVAVTSELGEVSVKPQDNYLLSVGTGKFYEGSATTVKGQLKEDIYKDSFGSPKQNQEVAGLKEFEGKVAQREQESPSLSSTEAPHAEKQSGLNPFQTTAKPWKE